MRAPKFFGILFSLFFALGAATAASAATPTPAPGVEVTQPSGVIVSHVTDGRVISPNSLALSSKYKGLAYVMNQEGAPVVYVIELTTGKVVGTTVLGTAVLKKPLGMAVDGGKLWIGDLGDRRGTRFGGTIYKITEPGRGAHVATPLSYAVSFGGLSSNINGLMIEPKSGRIYLVSRNDLGNGTFWRLPDPLVAGYNRATPSAKTVTPHATDAAFTPNGSKVLVLADKDVRLFNPRTWEEEAIVLPNPDTIPNGRGIAMAPDATAFYVISENPLTAAAALGVPTPSTPAPGAASAGPEGAVISKFPLTKQLGGVGVATDSGGTSTTPVTPVNPGVTLSPMTVGAGAIALVAGLWWMVALKFKRDRAARDHAERYGLKHKRSS